MNAAELKRRFQSHLITQQSTKLSEGDGSVKHQDVATNRCLKMEHYCDNSQRFNSYLQVHHIHCKRTCPFGSTYTCELVSHQALLLTSVTLHEACASVRRPLQHVEHPVCESPQLTYLQMSPCQNWYHGKKLPTEFTLTLILNGSNLWKTNSLTNCAPLQLLIAQDRAKGAPRHPHPLIYCWCRSDNTIPIAPRPPSSLTTEFEPVARAQVPSNYF